MPKLVYIAHPLSGDVAKNVQAILNILKEVHTEEVIPLAHYLVSLKYLDDGVQKERALGIAHNKEFFTRNIIDELWLCGPRISPGMQEEVKLCLKRGIPIKCHNKELQPELYALLAHNATEKVI